MTVAPAGPLLLSTISTPSAILKFSHLLAADWNEHGASKTWPGSACWVSPTEKAFPILYHDIVAGLVPPFSAFFLALHVHLGVQVLHIHPKSLTILAIFAFWCEAFVGLRPSVALFRHFYNVRINDDGLRARCMTFHLDRRWIDMDWEKKVDDFCQRWIFMDLGEENPHFVVPQHPVVWNDDAWVARELRSPGCSKLWGEPRPLMVVASPT
jgi:hypothetical protein